MRLKTLSLHHFRNYSEQTLVLSPEKNLFIGQNGQGKTNLLEAIYILSHTQSNRTHQERELMQRQAVVTTIHGEVEDNIGDSRVLQVQYHLEGAAQNLDIRGEQSGASLPTGRLKTRFKQNGVLLKSRSQFLGYLPSVSFFLSDLALLRGSPEERRRWLDAAITQIDKTHLNRVNHYQKIRVQKSKLLKEPYDSISQEHLQVWNDQLASAASKLTAARLRYLSQIQEQTTVHYAELSGGDALLSLAYQSSVLSLLSQNESVEETTLEQAYHQLLRERQADEIRRASCLVGPHRDDIGFQLGDMDAQSYGSQGQQRTIVLALKLSEWWLLQQLSEQRPMLLLDDVMAELDLSRQQFLIQHLDAKTQVLMTTTHMDQSWHRLFESEQEQVFEVSKGSVKPYERSTLNL